MYYESDLHVAQIGTSLMWVGGCDVYEDSTKQVLVTRFVYDSVPYDALKDMTETELEAHKEKLKTDQLEIPTHAKFITDYEDAKAKGLY